MLDGLFFVESSDGRSLADELPELADANLADEDLERVAAGLGKMLAMAKGGNSGRNPLTGTVRGNSAPIAAGMGLGNRGNGVSGGGIRGSSSGSSGGGSS